MKFALFLLAVFLVVFPEKADAYLDPGTGSYIIQIIAASFFAGIFIIKAFWSQIKRIILRILRRKDDKKTEKDSKNS